MVARHDDGNVQRRYARLAGVGVQFGAAITVFALAGHWLDGRFGTRPLLLILGVLLGFAGGTISLVLAVRAVNRGDGAPS
ncbi:MAG: AtpZ/AtpI family protein [Planctomycetota bacterium]|nr:AtpZ/AtpI family protein [Planctomycetota bacterium]